MRLTPATVIVSIAILNPVAAQLYPSAWLKLTDDRNMDRFPSWSPDQRSIAFVRDNDEGSGMDVVLVDLDGTNGRRLTAGNQYLFYPTWLPSADRLLVDVQNVGIVSVDALTGSQQLLFQPPGLAYATPAVSPDGLHIAYAAVSPGPHNVDVYVSDLDGGNAVRLTTHEEQDNRPSWSPDGSALVFERRGARSYIVNIDGTGLRLLAPDGMIARQPSWSPDGAKVAFSGGRGTDLYVIDVDGTGLRRLTETRSSIYAEFPAWSPDGRFIAFTGYINSQADIYVIDVDVAMTAVVPETWGRVKKASGSELDLPAR